MEVEVYYIRRERERYRYVNCCGVGPLLLLDICSNEPGEREEPAHAKHDSGNIRVLSNTVATDEASIYTYTV